MVFILVCWVWLFNGSGNEYCYPYLSYCSIQKVKMNYWLYIGLIVVAALWAVLDMLENENFFSSVFKNLNQKFWYKRISWQHARKILGYKWDAWHITKSIIICIILIPIAHNLLEYILMGISFNIVFSLTYKLLKTKH